MKRLLMLAACAAFFASCSSEKPYVLAGEVDPSLNGQTAYLYDYQSESVVDSVEVAEGRFRFSGKIAGDAVRRINIGRNYANVILGGGDFVVDLDAHTVAGSALNERKNRFEAQYDSLETTLYEKYKELTFDASLSAEELEAAQEKLMAEADAKIGELARPIVETENNALGAYVFWMWSSALDADEFDEAYGLAGQYVRDFGPVKKIVARNEAQKKTAEGMPFADFTIANGNADGTAASLSDYVGKGKYVLVDFWASWCGPCRREIPVIREVWEKYRGDKFEALGVAVWDEREDTQRAAEQLGIGWPQIVDAQSVPTDLYGIDGIPHIILFGPDGSIVARGLRGDALKTEVAEAMGE